MYVHIEIYNIISILTEIGQIVSKAHSSKKTGSKETVTPKNETVNC